MILINKKYIFPPNNYALSVTMNAPTQIRTKIIANTSDLYSELDLILSVKASIKHKIKGPHKSPILIL